MAKWLEALSDNIEVDKTKCIFCKKCVDKCILDNLRFKASPCRQACPLELNCQGYIQLIARGDESKALQTLYDKVLFPGILGYICEAPCEEKCSRNSVDGQSVAIRVLKRYLVDNVGIFGDKANLESLKGDILAKWQPQYQRSERIAVIGSGPAGIMAASLLKKYGYDVEIFEAYSKPGGMLAKCIPDYRLPDTIVEQEISLLTALGIKIHLNAFVDANALDNIAEEFDAVIIAAGTQKSKKLSGMFAGPMNTYTGIEFLERVKNKKTESIKLGKSIIIIGGGNVAVDAAQTARRLGVEKVSVVCLESHSDMPAFPSQVEEALEEGINIVNGWGCPEIKIEENKTTTSIVFQKCTAIRDENSNFFPKFDQQERLALEADAIIVAIGQEPDIAFLDDYIKDEDIASEVNQVTLQIGTSKIFAAGDMVTGASSVVKAMAQGRESAESVHRYLQGLPMLYGRNDETIAEIEEKVDLSDAIIRPSIKIPKLAVENRKSFKLIEQSISQKNAQKEAERCLSCGGPFGKHRTCWSCLPCEVECPEKALHVNVPYLMR